MRTPSEKALGASATPRACSMANVSRALWPAARTTAPAGIASRAGDDHPAHRARLDEEVGDPLPEAHLAAGGEDACAQRRHHAPQVVGADVRLGGDENLGRRAAGRQFGEDLVAAIVPDERVELAVRKGPGAAFAEHDVGLRVEDAALEQVRDVERAPFDGLPALEQQRAVPGLGEQQRGEEPRGAAADDHGPLGETLAPRLRGLVAVFRRGLELSGRRAREHGRRVRDLGVQQVDDLDAVLLAGVHRAARHPPGEQFVRGDAETLEERGLAAAPRRDREAA